MRRTFTWLFILAIITGVFSSCKKEFEKYENPDWLKGKIYTQIKATSDLDSFALCLERTGIDSIIDISGLFTVFAPTNQAFQTFFQQSPVYNKISDIPKEELERIVRYHILQSSWTIAQLQALDVRGWINPDDPTNDIARGYKRQTLLRDDDKKYSAAYTMGEYRLSNSVHAHTYRMVFTESRKYAPIFFDDFLANIKITGNDYNFFFNSGYAPGQMHYAGARVISKEIYSENGILYKLDEVVLPLKNAEELLEQEYNNHSYSDFLTMVHKHGRLSQNMAETMKIPAFKRGEPVDTLYNLTFPALTFNIRNELTNPAATPSTYTIRYHNGMVAPTNQALNDIYSEVITGPNRWINRDLVPDDINKILINSHMSRTPVYPTNFTQGFINGADDMVVLDPSTVIQTDYASNATFIGVNKAIIPKAFTSVTGPVYLSPVFSIFRRCIEWTNTLAAFKKQNMNFAFFIVPDDVITSDSSLFVTQSPINPEIMQFRSLDRYTELIVTRTRTDLANQLFNQTAITHPTGVGRKEFIQNLAGNYIVFDWETNTVSGGAASTAGYRGGAIVDITPQKIDEPTDNGSTYIANAWFSYPTENMYSVLNTPATSGFFNLMKGAGLVDDSNETLRFLTAGESYTAFIPSNEALLQHNTASMTNAAKVQFVRYHFVKGDIIFTDGKKPASPYPTLRVDESSTSFSTNFSNLHIRPAVDVIDILNPDGSLYYRVHENTVLTNKMASERINNTYVTTGVVHVINTVLIR